MLIIKSTALRIVLRVLALIIAAIALIIALVAVIAAFGATSGNGSAVFVAIIFAFIGVLMIALVAVIRTPRAGVQA